MLDKLLQSCWKLALQHERDSFPPKLTVLGVQCHNRVCFKRYRVLDDQVVMLLIAYGRRSLKTRLERRMLDI